MYIPFEQHELIDQKYSTVDSQRSLSAENRFTTDGNDSSLYLAYSLVTANDRTSSMDTNGKSHEKSTNSSQNKYVYQNVAFNNEDDIQKSDDKSRECLSSNWKKIRVITKLPNSEQSYKGKVKTHNYINRQNQSTTGKL
jgi:hypothetical protein